MEGTEASDPAPATHKHEHHVAASHSKAGAGSLKNMLKIDKGYVKAAALFFLIAAVVFYPLLLGINSVAPGVGGDTFQNLWDIWWVGYSTVSLHTSFYQTNLLFYPVGANLIFQTMSPLMGLASVIFQGVSVQFAYNIMFFIGFILSGLTMMLLADYIVKNRYAAFLAGVIFAFSAFHVAQGYSHIEWINLEWAPLAVYFFIRLIKEHGKPYKDGLGLGISYLLIAFGAGMEQALVVLFLLILVAIAYMIEKTTRKAFLSTRLWKGIGVAVVSCFILGFWGFVPVLSAVLAPGGLQNVNLLNTQQYNQLWSDDLLSFFVPSIYNGVFSGLVAGTYSTIYATQPVERTAYIGYVAIILALLGIMSFYKKEQSIKLWVAIAAIFFLISLGPNLQVNGNITSVPGLYSLYHALPGFNVVREPGRFDFVTMMAVAMLSAFGMKVLLERTSQKGGILSNGAVVLAIVGIAVLIESAGVPLTQGFIGITTTPISVPPVYSQIGQYQGNFSVLTLPALPDQQSSLPALYPGMNMFYMTQAKKPMVGGYVTRENVSQQISLYNIPFVVQSSNLQTTGNPSFASPVNQSYANQTLLALYNYNTAVITLNAEAYNKTTLVEMVNYLDNVFGKPIYVDNTTGAWSTDNAILNSIYKNFVAYPNVAQWQQVAAYINGTSVPLWVPNGPGGITVYAPYPQGIKVSNLTGLGPRYTVNATISFAGVATSGAGVVTIAQVVNNRTYTVKQFNLTSVPGIYTANVQMYSGPVGNSYFFIVGSPQTTISGGGSSVGLTDIRFYRS